MRGALAIALLLLAPSVRAADLESPAGPSAQAEAGFVAAHADAPLVVLHEWEGLDLQVKGSAGTLSGRHLSVLEYRIQDRSVIEAASLVQYWDQPSRRIENVEVTVRTGSDTRRFRRKDLSWLERTSQDGGVVILDGTFATAPLPGLQVGSVVRIVREWKLQDIHGLSGWQLGSREYPTLLSSLVVRVPERYELGWGIQGSDRALPFVSDKVLDESRRYQAHEWTLRAGPNGEVPGCEGEFETVRITPFVASTGEDDRVGLAVGSTWADVGQAYLDNIERYLQPSPDIEHVVQSLADGVDDRQQLIDRIYSDVQKRCRYLGLFEGMGGVLPAPASEVFDSGFGDCKGLGTLLLVMLRTAGIEAHPALVRTRPAGPLDREAPSLAQFNHFIVWADDLAGGTFLDATVDHCPAGEVPSQDTLSPVLLLRPDRIALVEIDPESWSAGRIEVMVEGRLGDTGMLELEFRRSWRGEVARWIRGRLAGASRRDREELAQALVLGRRSPLRFDSCEVIGQSEWKEPLVIEVAARTRAPLPVAAGSWLFPSRLGSGSPEFDPSTRCDRSEDLRLWPGWNESWSIVLPDGVALAEPDSLGASDEDVAWSRHLWQEGNVLRFECDIDLAARPVPAESAERIHEVLRELRRRESGHFLLSRALPAAN